MAENNYPHRLLCDVLEEMRATYKTRNFASLLGLIEEAQSLANRMEAGLEYGNDIEDLHKQRKDLNGTVADLVTKITELRKEKKDLFDEIDALKDEVQKLEDKITQRISLDHTINAEDYYNK